MRLFFFVPVVTAAVAWPIVAQPADGPVVDPGALARASAVVVLAHVASHRDTIGAGVVVAVSPTLVRFITARHVVATGDPYVICAGHAYAAEVVRTFAHRDLAVIVANAGPACTRGLQPARAGQTAQAGMRVVLWGEDDAGLRLEHGAVVADASDLVQLSCDICVPGDSGAGIFDGAGRLIGILTSRWLSADGHVVAVLGESVDPSLYEAPDAVETALAPAS